MPPTPIGTTDGCTYCTGAAEPTFAIKCIVYNLLVSFERIVCMIVSCVCCVCVCAPSYSLGNERIRSSGCTYSGDIPISEALSEKRLSTSEGSGHNFREPAAFANAGAL